VWLDPAKTSVYRFYQFWINTDDRDVIRYLKYFTFLGAEEIADLEAEHARDPGARTAHRALARAVTELVHGPTATAEAIRASQVLFGGELDGIPEATFREIMDEVPTLRIDRTRLDGQGLALVELLVQAGLCPSKSQARKDIEGGGIYLNNLRQTSVTRQVQNHDLLFGRHLLLRKGKKHYVLVTAE